MGEELSSYAKATEDKEVEEDSRVEVEKGKRVTGAVNRLCEKMRLILRWWVWYNNLPTRKRGWKN